MAHFGTRAEDRAPVDDDHPLIDDVQPSVGILRVVRGNLDAGRWGVPRCGPTTSGDSDNFSDGD